MEKTINFFKGVGVVLIVLAVCGICAYGFLTIIEAIARAVSKGWNG